MKHFLVVQVRKTLGVEYDVKIVIFNFGGQVRFNFGCYDNFYFKIIPSIPIFFFFYSVNFLECPSFVAKSLDLKMLGGLPGSFLPGFHIYFSGLKFRCLFGIFFQNFFPLFFLCLDLYFFLCMKL